MTVFESLNGRYLRNCPFTELYSLFNTHGVSEVMFIRLFDIILIQGFINENGWQPTANPFDITPVCLSSSLIIIQIWYSVDLGFDFERSY